MPGGVLAGRVLPYTRLDVQGEEILFSGEYIPVWIYFNQEN